MLGALADAGVERRAVDGFGVSSFSLAPDHAIDLAWRLGLSLRWLMEDTNGGAGGLNMLQHALRAIEAGDAETIVLCAGDRLDRDGSAPSSTTTTAPPREQLAPLPSAARTPLSRSSPSATRSPTGSSAPTTPASRWRSAPGRPATRAPSTARR